MYIRPSLGSITTATPFIVKRRWRPFLCFALVVGHGNHIKRMTSSWNLSCWTLMSVPPWIMMAKADFLQRSPLLTPMESSTSELTTEEKDTARSISLTRWEVLTQGFLTAGKEPTMIQIFLKTLCTFARLLFPSLCMYSDLYVLYEIVCFLPL